MFSLLISMIICFLNSFLIVTLILDKSFFLSLLAIFWILMILLDNSLENAFFILRISLILSLVA